MRENFIVGRRQRVKIHDTSEWLPIQKGVPQGSVLGLLLFNIFWDNFCTTETNIDTYADDNQHYFSYECPKTVETTINGDF